MSDEPIRPWEELRSTGILWLINAAVFHPRGFAMAVAMGDDDKLIGWKLLGDGSEPWRFADDVDVPFADVEAFLDDHRPKPRLIHFDRELTEADAEAIKQRFLAAQHQPPKPAA